MYDKIKGATNNNSQLIFPGFSIPQEYLIAINKEINDETITNF